MLCSSKSPYLSLAFQEWEDRLSEWRTRLQVLYVFEKGVTVVVTEREKEGLLATAQKRGEGEGRERERECKTHRQKLVYFLREAKRKKLKFLDPRAKLFWRRTLFGDDAVACGAEGKKFFPVQSTKDKTKKVLVFDMLSTFYFSIFAIHRLTQRKSVPFVLPIKKKQRWKGTV